VIDGAAKGAPFLNVNTRPTNQNNGRLLGNGAGYPHWNRISPTVYTSFGLGMAGQNDVGIIPVSEGQLSNLSPGTYVLRVIPSPGVNVLRGDLALTSSQNAFAVGADTTQGSDITFTITNSACQGGPSVQLASAASRRVHGGVNRDLALDLSTPVREPRSIGAGSPAVVLTFSAPPGAMTCANVTLTNATCGGVAVSGSTATVSLGGLTANQCVKVQVTGIAGFTGDSDVHVVHHTGDLDANSLVNLLDLQEVKNALFQAVGAGNFTRDVNVDNLINLLDLQEVKTNLFQASSACP
jgi:hypothetical protein